ncbi:MAG: hypothetical protein LBJ36_06215 [Synergistaceae bacterium]|nr:hypothetical protein [Synergistaceae bacterium]
MAGKEIIVTNGYFNNLRLFGANTTFPAAAKAAQATRDVTYGLKLYFEQWDEVGSPIGEDIGIYSGTSPTAIPQVLGRFAAVPVVFTPAEISSKGTLLRVISELLPGKAGGDITEPEFQGYDPGGNPPNPVDSPYLMNLTLGTTDPAGSNNPNDPNQKVRYTGHESTDYEFGEDGSIVIHWKGESWMYFVGSPNPNLTPGSPPPQEPDVPHYPNYPEYLIYQFVFDGPNGTNEYITPGKIVDGYLVMTLSWERLSFDYIYGVREVDGVKRQAGIIKNLKRLGK